jgi:hypothetical protein
VIARLCFLVLGDTFINVAFWLLLCYRVEKSKLLARLWTDPPDESNKTAPIGRVACSSEFRGFVASSINVGCIVQMPAHASASLKNPLCCLAGTEMCWTVKMANFGRPGATAANACQPTRTWKGMLHMIVWVSVHTVAWTAHSLSLRSLVDNHHQLDCWQDSSATTSESV